MLGGITRLTGSGLSITRWDIVTGTVPPLSKSEWQEAFELYQETPQYRKINEGMSLSRFKFIYFWEYIHRLWARAMGFVFAIPFFIFLIRGSISRLLLRRLLIVILLAGLAAIFGWIMVASGLVNRPWVNAYKLTIHLGLGIAVFVYLFFTWLSYTGYKKLGIDRQWRIYLRVLILLAVVQIGIGGLVSGMKAALNYPTWPSMHGEYIPEILLERGHWNSDSFLMYDQSGFMPALVQFTHRNLAYLISIFVVVFGLIWWKKNRPPWRWISFGLIGIIVVQLVLGILTLLNSVGSIPVFYGALHQGVGILFLTFLLYIYQVIRPIKI